MVPVEEAVARARALGLSGDVDFRAPSSSRLPDGSTLVAAPTTAVALAHVSEPCSTALRDPSARGAVAEVLGLLDRVRSAPVPDNALLGQLTPRLARLRESGVLSCDPALEGAVTELGRLFGKLQVVRSRQTSSELTYAKHAEAFRAMKRDLRALSEVLQADAKSVAAARAKTAAVAQRSLPGAAKALSEASRRLRRLGELAGRIS